MTILSRISELGNPYALLLKGRDFARRNVLLYLSVWFLLIPFGGRAAPSQNARNRHVLVLDS
ncbi:MAG: hypothetical protein MIO93_14635, partial [ANME-2 cluster archaeon]|nr:hypothetical protein [ANME-2 cluster archaeon]